MCIAGRIKINTEHLALTFSCLLLAIDLINMGCVDILNTPHIMRIYDAENLVSCPLTEQLFPIMGGKNGARENWNTAINLKRSRDIAEINSRDDLPGCV